MKYQLTDCFEALEFHDVFLKLESFENDTLTLSAKHLNIHKEALPNRSLFDKELGMAKITLQKLSVHSFSREAYTSEDGNGKLLEIAEQLDYPVEEAENAFLNELKSGNHISDFYKDGNEYVLEIHGFHLFSARLSFSSFMLEWDDIIGNAWYEESKLRSITLKTPSGDLKTNIEIKETNHHYQVSILYKKKLYQSRKEEYTEKAFAELQKKLPEGVSIKCCLTCAHGNLCPYGNIEYEIFCIKDHILQEKLDLIDLMDQEDHDFLLRSRLITDLCDDFTEQNDEHYTYNDYLYYLKKEN